MSFSVAELKSLLKEALFPDYYRYAHSLFVFNISEGLIGSLSDIEIHKSLQVATLLHDICKNMSLGEATEYSQKYHEVIPRTCIDFPVSLHGFMARLKLKHELRITDQDILKAVEFHTTGCPHLSYIGMILYIADFLASLNNRVVFNRVFALGISNLYRATYDVATYKIQEVKNKGQLVHPLSLEFQDWLLKQPEFNKE